MWAAVLWSSRCVRLSMATWHRRHREDQSAAIQGRLGLRLTVGLLCTSLIGKVEIARHAKPFDLEDRQPGQAFKHEAH